MSSKQNKFFLLSFFPAIAYWYLETRYPLKIAITGGIILAVLEIVLEKIFVKHVHTLSKFNFLLLVFLAALSLLGEDGIWFKLQPFFTGWILGGVLIYYLRKGKGLMMEMIEEMGNNQLPDHLFQRLEWHMAILMICYGTFMGGVAIWLPTAKWLFFKTAGFYLVFIIFMLIEFFFIRKTMLEEQKRKIQQETLKKF